MVDYQPSFEGWIERAVEDAARTNTVVVAIHGLEPHVRAFPDGSVGIRREDWSHAHVSMKYEVRGSEDSQAGAWSSYEASARRQSMRRWIEESRMRAADLRRSARELGVEA